MEIDMKKEDERGEDQERSLSGLLEVFDPIIKVDRSITPVYAVLAKGIPIMGFGPLYPRFHQVGPAEFNIRQAEGWWHQMQRRNELALVSVVHEHIVQEGMLEKCLGLQDLLEIQERGENFFNLHFEKGMMIYARKGAAISSCGKIRLIPYLTCNSQEGVVQRWDRFEHHLSRVCTALLYGSSS